MRASATSAQRPCTGRLRGRERGSPRPAQPRGTPSGTGCLSPRWWCA